MKHDSDPNSARSPWIKTTHELKDALEAWSKTSEAHTPGESIAPDEKMQKDMESLLIQLKKKIEELSEK